MITDRSPLIKYEGIVGFEEIRLLINDHLDQQKWDNVSPPTVGSKSRSSDRRKLIPTNTHGYV